MRRDFKGRLAEIDVSPYTRDRTIDAICAGNRSLSPAGGGAARYNTAMLGHFGAANRPGCSGARLSSVSGTMA